MFRYNWQFVVMSCCMAVVLGCLPTEFTCESGQCIDGARFCDGTTDCADGTDEHQGCTNCNRTYYGMSGVKYPLRLNEPLRQIGSVCTLTFIAAGGIYGDIVEITFLSFQIGVFQLESSMCYKGFMEVEDSQMYSLKKRSVQYPRKLRKKVTPGRQETPKSRMDRVSSMGSFCGIMIGKSATFYSDGDKVNLNILMSPQMSEATAAPRLYLTYRFLHRKTAEGDEQNVVQSVLPKSNCGGTFTDCYLKNCRIQSPNYPGFYLRNLTCLYLVTQTSTSPGHVAQIEVFQNNDFKISILTGLTNTDRYKPGVLTSDCAGDVIRVYDGRTTMSPLLAEFCGSGPLLVIRSSGPELLIELRSVPFQPLASSRFELEVRVHLIPKSVFRITSNQCTMNIDAGRSRTGVLRIPDHSIAANTTCSFRISGKKPSDKIWFYFVVYSVPDLHPWSDHEHCDVAKLSIIYPKLKFRHLQSHHHHPYRYYHQKDPLPFGNSSTTLIGTFCEKTSPFQCGHAFDFADYVPSRPCSVSKESYLTTGPELLLELAFLKAMAVHGLIPHFAVRYELIDVDQPLSSDDCSVRVRSNEGKSGWLENPRNLFLYGRGGNRNLSCLYELRGDDSERIRVVVQKVRFMSHMCLTSYHPKTLKYNCALKKLNSRYAVINVTEIWRDLSLPIGCVCDGNFNSKQEEPLVIESVGNKIDLLFEIRSMGPRDDFRTFHFEVMYEFLPASVCDSSDYVMTGSEGHVKLDAEVRTRCRWILVSLPSRGLYITVKGRKYDDSCQNKYLFYGLYEQEPFAVFCASKEEEFISLFTDSESDSLSGVQHFQRALTLLEVTAQDHSDFSVHWIEVTRRSRNYDPSNPFPVCELECPELEACISTDLACDGTKHCPETAEDESPERCVQFPLLTVVFCASAALVVCFLTCFSVFIVRYQMRRREKTPIPSQIRSSGICKDTARMSTMSSHKG